MKISELIEILQWHKDEEGDVEMCVKIDKEKHKDFIVYSILTCSGGKEETILAISLGVMLF